MKPLTILRKSYLLVVAGVMAVVLLAVMISGTLAEEADPPVVVWAQQEGDACLPYFVTVDTANVRACALIGCRVVEQVERDENLCVLGPAVDSDEWLEVDLEPANASSPIYYINQQVVAPGAPGQAQAGFEACQSWLVNQDRATVYTCSEPGCGALGDLLFEDWLCGHYYSSIPDWVYAVDSDRNLAGWVERSAVVPSGSNTGEPVLFEPPATLESAGGVSTVPQETPLPSVTPAESPITIDGQLPACQQYFVSSVQAPVRECAGAGCGVVDVLTLGEGVCIRGVTDNPEWLIVSLTTTEDTPALYAIEAGNITLGRAPDDVLSRVYANCEEYWGVDVTSNVNVRQCPSETCPVLDTVEPGEWVCVDEYGGEYEAWLRADVPGGLAGVWINADVMVELTGDALPFAVAQAATATPTQEAASETADTNAAASCTTYVVNVVGATGGNLRSCPSIACDLVETVAQGGELCVLGVDPEDSNWLVVERSPDVAGDELAYISSEIVEPLAGANGGVGVTPGVAAQLIQPTGTPQPTQPVCEPGSALANCVTVTPTPILTPVPENVPMGPLLAQEISLASLRIPNIELISPIGSSQFSFYVPDDWVPAGNNVLYLDMEYFETQARNRRAGLEDVELITLLDVYMDDQLIATVSLAEENVGKQTLSIPLPLNLLSDPELREHLIRLELRAEDHCLLNDESQIFVRSDLSYFHLEFRESVPILDLSLYPRPFYNQRFIDQTETVYIVLSDDPQPSDVEVAMGISAGLGALTYNDLSVRVVTASELDATTSRSYNLILVGELGSHALIQQYYAAGLFPSELADDGTLTVEGESLADTDGLVQIIPNPNNENLALLAVTGQTPEALAKAGQAMSGPPSLMGIGGPVAIVTEARPVLRPPVGFTLDAQVTFAELGYPLINLGGYGVSTSDVRFYLPASFQLTEDAYVDLEFNYSNVLEGSRATVALFMNGDYPLASTYLDAAQPNTVTNGDGEITVLDGGPYHLRARIPAEAVNPGDLNRLNIIVTVAGDWDCYPPEVEVAWFTVSGNSLLNLPRARVDVDAVRPLVGTFPVPFNTQPDLRDVWFALSDEPTTSEIEQALRIAARLGTSVDSGEGFAPHVSMGTLPEGVDLSEYNLIIIGRYTTNSLLATLNDNLPQPFVPDTDQLLQVLDDVSYRLPTGYEIGLLEMLTSPWSVDHTILVISGTGVVGQNYATSALADFLYGRSELLGDVVYVGESSISTIDTRAIEYDDELIEEIEDAIRELDAEATQQAQAAIDARATAAALAETPVAMLTDEAAVTATPLPTLSPTPSLTPGPTFTPTPLFTDTPAPVLPTPIPTFAPLPQEAIEPAENDPPGWFGGLILVAGVLALVTVIFGMLRLLGGSRR